MKLLSIILFFEFLFAHAFAQRRFIKVNSDIGYGSEIRIVATNNGWITVSMDSMRMTKFDECGKIIWSRKYLLPNEEYRLNDIVPLRSGDILLMTRMFNPIDLYNICLLTRLDSSGNIVWCKSYQDAYNEQYGYSLGEFANGDLFLYANIIHGTGSPGFNMACRLTSSGNLIWGKIYDHGGIWGGGIVTSDQGLLLRTGDLFIKTDPSGNVLWTTWGSSTGTYHYTKPLEVSDGYIYTKYKSGSRRIVFYKLNMQGLLLPGKSKIASFTGDYPRISLTSSGTITAISNIGNNSVIVEMDKDLNVLRQGTVDYNGQSLYAKDFCFSGNEAVLAGFTGNSQMFFAKLDDLYKSSCDVLLPLMQLEDDTIYQNTQQTTVNTIWLAEVNHSYSYLNVIDKQKTLCTNPLELNLGPDINICSSSSFLLRNNLLGLFDEYEWSTGETTPYIHINDAGTYWVKAIQYCEDSIAIDTIVITVDTVPEPGWEGSLIECENTSVTLYAPICSTCIYQWNTGETADSIVVSNSGTYSLMIENSSRCQSTDSIDVAFSKCECELYIPNTFTPNNDGINEVFKPVYYCEMNNYELTIFNRLGKVVFTTKNPEEGWTGFYKNSAGIEDIYNYTVQYTPVIRGVGALPVNKSGRVGLVY